MAKRSVEKSSSKITPENRYLLLRHGESTGNVLGSIASHPVNARYGARLTARGRRQVFASYESLRSQIQRESTVIYSSDFARARETAELMATHLGVAAPQFDPTISPLLRERRFGALEGLSTRFYQLVWAADARGELFPGVEAAFRVASRMRQALEILDSRHQQQTVLLVSHGDPIQMLLADKALGSPLRHRDLPPVATAEFRFYS